MPLDRSKAPEFHIPENFELSHPEKLMTPAGVPVYFFHTPLLEAVKIEIISKSSRINLPLSKTLVPSFTLQLLTEGTKLLTEEQLSEFFDFHASEVHPFSGFSQEGLSLLTTKKHLEKVLPVFLSLFTESVFAEEKIQKKKTLRKVSLRLEMEKNASRASMLFRHSLFGPNHPYGLEVKEEHIESITREDLLEYYQHSLWRDAELLISGDFTPLEINNLVQELGPIPKVNFEKKSSDLLLEGIESIVEEKPDALQTSIRIGAWSIPKSDQDYIPLTVFNTVLGGYFGSRLIKNIREDKGHTYGIHSTLGEIDNFNYWVISADVQKNYRKEVIQEIYKEIQILAEKTIETEELEQVRNYLIGQMVGRFSSSFDLADRFKAVHFSGLDFGFYLRQLDFFRKFGAEDLQRIGQKYFRQEKANEVLVG
ncbi:MAG: insulinase family protein [Cyclobacteriaceae bacterium]|nr:insulinase family protein [Cyclobacteriaceae bacterium]MDX5466384.1 insulinase family protein [Cyclobacteriaceae bacterium]